MLRKIVKENHPNFYQIRETYHWKIKTKNIKLKPIGLMSKKNNLSHKIRYQNLNLNQFIIKFFKLVNQIEKNQNYKNQ